MANGEFDPGNFKTIYESDFGQELWAYMSRADSLIRMETASFLERPAVEPLSPGLLQLFGEKVREDRIRQLLGRMARQLLENRGYQIDQQSVRIPAEHNVFSSGTRYKLRS